MNRKELDKDLVEAMLKDLERKYPNKSVLSVHELANFLDCPIDVVYNWNRRSDEKRRPPRLMVGKEARYQKQALARWLVLEMGGGLG